MENKNNKIDNNLGTKVYVQKPADFSHTIEVSATCVNVDGKLLFLKLAHGKLEAGAWGVPAGKLEVNETPLKAANRELYEETGIEILDDQFQSFGQLYIRKPNIDYIYHLFGVNLDRTPQVHLSNEHLTYKWVSRQEAESLPLMNGAQQALDFYYRCNSKKQRLGANVNVYLILREGEKILLCYRKNTGYCDNLYGLVSGHVEDGESATAAMIREAYEEIGIHLKLDSLKTVHVLHRKTNRLNVDIFFECSEWQGEIINREPDKCGGLDFFTFCDLPNNTIDYIEVTLNAIYQKIFYSEIGWEK